MMECRPIGIIRTPYREREGMPIQPGAAKTVCGTLEIKPEFEEGLSDLDGFSHIILLYQFHLSEHYALSLTPFLDTRERGLFSTRAPRRPNPIGLSIVRLCRVDGRRVEVEGIDVVDGTPLLDIKPYVPEFDQPDLPIRIGWVGQAKKDMKTTRSDKRFISS
jgi:tRNA (adenine37-N6)-methyltransferase